MKKFFLYLLLALVVIVAGFFTCQYIRYAQDDNPDKTFLLPRIELSVLEITNLEKDRIDMTANMLVENQLPVAFRADSLFYTVFVDNTEVLRTRYAGTIDLAPNDSSWISLPLTILMDTLQSVLEKNEKQQVDSVEYRIHTTFHSNLWLKKNFELDLTRRLPLIYLPEVTVDHLEIDSLNFHRALVKLHTSVINKNAFPLRARDATYRFAVEGHSSVEGMIGGLIDIAARDTTAVEIPIEISLGELGKGLFQILTKANQVTYDLYLAFYIESENAMVNNSKTTVQSDGPLKTLRKAMKDK